MNNCNNNCDQGRSCTCNVYKKQYWELRKNHLEFKELIVHLLLLVCAFSSLCFWFGYWWARTAT
jgi:hypothetical protein